MIHAHPTRYSCVPQCPSISRPCSLHDAPAIAIVRHKEWAKGQYQVSCGIKDLLDGLPPVRVPRLGARGALDEALLPRVGHLPPLANLWVLSHALHVCGEIVANVLEAGEEEGGVLVVPDAVYRSHRVRYWLFNRLHFVDEKGKEKMSRGPGDRKVGVAHSLQYRNP